MSKSRKQFLARLLTFLALASGSAANANGSTFTYDAKNHLTGMSVSGTTVSIAYDAFGNRVSKTVNGVTTKYLVEDDVNPTGYPQVMEEIVGGWRRSELLKMRVLEVSFLRPRFLRGPQQLALKERRRP